MPVISNYLGPEDNYLPESTGVKIPNTGLILSTASGYPYNVRNES